MAVHDLSVRLIQTNVYDNNDKLVTDLAGATVTTMCHELPGTAPTLIQPELGVIHVLEYRDGAVTISAPLLEVPLLHKYSDPAPNRICLVDMAERTYTA
jgi:hypothetical protein